MALPKFDVRGGARPRSIILLSGFKPGRDSKDGARPQVLVQAEDKLQQSAKRYPDAVAFGFTGGKWIPAA